MERRVMETMLNTDAGQAPITMMNGLVLTLAHHMK